MFHSLAPVHRLHWIALLAACLLLCGCVSMQDPEAEQVFRTDTVATIQPGQTVGQTLISRRPRLNSIQLWLRIAPGVNQRPGNVTFQLYHNPADSQPLFVVTLSSAQIAANSPIKIALPARADPDNQRYYLTLTSNDSQVQVQGRNEDAYPNGQLFLNGVAEDSDLAFRLSYDYDLGALATDLQQQLAGAWVFVPLLSILLLPGWLLLSLLGLRDDLDGGEQIAAALGLSMSCIPLLTLWTTTVGLHWNRTAVWFVTGLVWLGVIFVEWRRWRYFGHPGLKQITWRRVPWALLMVFVSTLVLRLSMVRDLAAPAWVDSVHHALLARLISDLGAYPSSYAPFIDVNTASYHTGFHSIVALLHWLSGLDISQGLLLLGQVLNALTVLAVYAFTRDLTGKPVAGITAALVTGFFTPMPAYYTSWGRYTELAGFLILPAAAILLERLMQSAVEVDLTLAVDRRRLVQRLLAAALACAGLFITHYRVAAFLGIWVLLSFCMRFFQAWRDSTHSHAARRLLIFLFLTTIAAILLVFPWVVQTVTTLFIPKLAWSQGNYPLFGDFSWGYLDTALGKYAMAAAGLGFVTGLLRRHGRLLLIPLWVALMFVIANLGAYHLPGGGFVNNTSVEIILFLPIAALCGELIAWLVDLIEQKIPLNWHGLFQGNLALAGIILMILGARTLLPILNPVTVLFHQGDAAAMTWIEANVPVNETIAINPFLWGYNMQAGSDGGFWISAIARRKTMPPPVLYGLSDDPAYVQNIQTLCQGVSDHGAQPEALYSLLQRAGIHYLYAGVHSGAISPKALSASPLFQTRYAVDGTWVFELAKPKK